MLVCLLLKGRGRREVPDADFVGGADIRSVILCFRGDFSFSRTYDSLFDLQVGGKVEIGADNGSYVRSPHIISTFRGNNESYVRMGGCGGTMADGEPQPKAESIRKLRNGCRMEKKRRRGVGGGSNPATEGRSKPSTEAEASPLQKAEEALYRKRKQAPPTASHRWRNPSFRAGATFWSFRQSLQVAKAGIRKVGTDEVFYTGMV